MIEKTLSPILISLPHSSVAFPEEVHSYYKDEVLKSPADTDWFLDQLYDFAPSLGIEIVMAPYSRYVIDLNRDPENKSLYSDKRVQTSLIPTKTFSGRPLLNKEIDQDEFNRRVKLYYWSYYKNIEEKLNQRVQVFGKALLFDGHSIKRNVPTIRQEDFPDLILGTADKKSASENIIQKALACLNSSPFEVAHNAPFKGGHITRYFGKPENSIHALQLEMSQDLYMDEKTTEYNEVKANKMKTVLSELFKDLLEELES